MVRAVTAFLILIVAPVALAQTTQPVQAVRQITVPWAVSVVHTIDLQKMVEQMREQQKLRVGVAGTAPPFMYNITTGIVVDDQGHVVTRLANLDPQDKEHKLSVTASDGTTMTAKLIGVDLATGFAVLEVALLKSAAPKVVMQGNLLNGAAVNILTSDVVQKSIQDRVYLAPAITVSHGRVLAGSLYSGARGALTLLSDSLRARSDSSVVVTTDNQVIGIAQYAGFGRAYLYPIQLIRDTIAKRVIEKQNNVPAGWLGVRGVSVAELSDTDISRIGLERKSGVIVRLVQTESPAARAGLLLDDVITRVDDFDVAGEADLRAFLSQMPAGQAIKLRTIRNHQPVEINAVLGARPTAEFQQNALFDQSHQPERAQRDQLEKRRAELGVRLREYARGASKEDQEAYNELAIEIRQINELLRAMGPGGPDPLVGSATPAPTYAPAFTSGSDISFQVGFTARDLTPQLAASLQARGGVWVSNVFKGSAAERAGLKAGDVIIEMQERVLLSAAQLQAFLSSQRGTITFKVVRTKEPIAVSLILQ